MASLRLSLPRFSLASGVQEHSQHEPVQANLRKVTVGRSTWLAGEPLAVHGIKGASKNCRKARGVEVSAEVDGSVGQTAPSTDGSVLFASPDQASKPTLNSLDQQSASAVLSTDESDFSVRIDNTSSPGCTVVELQGVHQEDLLVDVTSVFSSFNISVKEARIMTQEQRVLDVFLIVDAETKTAISTERSLEVQKAILKKLENRKRIQTSLDDPKLAEQESFLLELMEKVVAAYGDSAVVESAKFLQNGFKALRDKENPRKRAELLRYIEKMDVSTITGVVRLYYLYSSLLNVVDEAHAHRKRREQVWASRSATPLWYASFDHTFRTFRKADVGPQELQKLLNKIEYTPVFTAHPTEARRREVLKCLHRIFLLCSEREDPRLSQAQRAELNSEVEAEIEVLWRTDEMRVRKPSVLEEVLTGLDYFRLSLFDAVCTTYRYAENSLEHVYPSAGLKLPSFIKFGSWIGGDRDGNPFVLPETTEMAALISSRLILIEYIGRCKKCEESLTHSLLICNVSSELLDSLKKDREMLDKVPAVRPELMLFEHEPYRLKLRAMRHRLEQNIRRVNSYLRTFSDFAMEDTHWLVDMEYNMEELPGQEAQTDAYPSEEDFLADLKIVDTSLRTHGDSRLANSKLKDLIRLAETFGFYLCALDVRQESMVHAQAVEECLQLLGCEADYKALDNLARVEILTQYLRSSPPMDKGLFERMTESTRQVVKVLDAVANIKERISSKAVASYVISMTRESCNVLEVLFLGWIVNRDLVRLHENGEWSAKLVVAPLFETIPDLEHMPLALQQLMESTTYKEILAASGGVQEVMLGYSDSCKDGGITASAFNLYKAQEVIRNITTAAGVRSRIFHGRGGTVGRGAGPTHESVLSQPPGSVNGKIKFTEQGEVITYRYGNSETATYELSVGVTAVMKASHPATRHEQDFPPKYFNVMEEVMAGAEKSYRELTEETEGFYDYFYDGTVVNEISLMNIGSRPARRKAAVRDKTSLRAIPWVFGWSQSRHTLPGWYGVGSGLLAYSGNRLDRIRQLQQMYRDWPFFRTFLSNVQMSLFKASMEIALEYSRLCQNRITQRLVFELVQSEYELTKSQILMVAQLNSLQEDNSILKRSFGTRRDYLDPLNHIQIILLGRRRDPQVSAEDLELFEKPLLRTIKAIASNMRNTG